MSEISMAVKETSRIGTILGIATIICGILAMAMPMVSPAFAAPAAAQDKPNILIIWGDDIGWFNINAYNRGMMGYDTPNIDRIANDGILFTDAYGQNSCTAGRAAFLTGQSPFTDTIVEIGAGRVLTGLARRIDRDLTAISVSTPSDIDELVRAL